MRLATVNVCDFDACSTTTAESGKGKDAVSSLFTIDRRNESNHESHFYGIPSNSAVVCHSVTTSANHERGDMVRPQATVMYGRGRCRYAARCDYRKRVSSFRSWILLLLWWHQAGAVIFSPGRQCKLNIFVPITIDGVTPAPASTATFTTFANASLTGDTNQSHTNNLGMSHLAAAVLAIEHFNTRQTDGILKPEDEAMLQRCNITFANDPVAFDTATESHQATRLLLLDQQTQVQRKLQQQFQTSMSNVSSLGDDIFPCAMAGPFHDTPALDLSSWALSSLIPLVVHRAYNFRVVTSHHSPFTSMVYPDAMATAGAVVDFLQFWDRTDFISLITPLSDTGLHMREMIGLALNYVDGFDHVSSHTFLLPGSQQSNVMQSNPFMSTSNEGDSLHSTTGASSIFSTLRDVKKRGYRTIVVGFQDMPTELPELADAAEAANLNNGDYLWIGFGLTDPIFARQALLETQSPDYNPNITKLLNGSFFLSPLDNGMISQGGNPFENAWRKAGPAVVDRLNAVNPIPSDQPAYYYAPSDYFQIYPPEMGASFMYDAVMSIGIGACLAEQTVKPWVATNRTGNPREYLTGQEHLEGIWNVSFRGATGDVRFGSPGRPGARNISTVVWVALNIVVKNPSPTGLYNPYVAVNARPAGDNTSWQILATATFADGRSVPPDLLRDTPDQNYLNKSLGAFGFALMGIALLSSLTAACWIYLHREHRVLKAAQPPFLYLLTFGAAMYASAIFGLTADESYGWSVDQISRLCMATPWLLSLAHMLTYGSLFTKLWRVHKVLQFSRRKIEIRHVAWPVGILFVLTLIDLSLWTALDSLSWERTTLNDDTGESIGQCKSSHFFAFATPLLILSAIPTVMTGLMAYKTKDIDEAYSESSWIFMLIVAQLEVALVAGPIVVLLMDLSAAARYFGSVVMLWSFPMTTLTFIVLPKVVAYRRDVAGYEAKTKRGSGGKGALRVSGLSAPYADGASDPPRISGLSNNSVRSTLATSNRPTTVATNMGTTEQLTESVYNTETKAEVDQSS